MNSIITWARQYYYYVNNEIKKNNKSQKREITKRGVIWLGQTCNLACYFCYFIDKIDNKQHPEHPFMSLEKAKKICYNLRFIYGNNAVDIQGGEPTIYPYIIELIEYCNSIGLKPTLITNAIVLSDKKRAESFKNAGINDFLISVHAIGETYNRMVGHKNGSLKQMQALKVLQELEIPFRLNCTMTKEVVNQFEDIAILAIETGCKVVNFISFNPFADQKGNRNSTDVPNYTLIKQPLERAIDILENADIEVNIRYFPMCMVNEKYYKNSYNFQQLPYDSHEWDFNSWTWTTRFNQRSNSDSLDETIPILMFNIKKYNGIDFSKMSEHGTKEHYMKGINLEEHLLKLISANIPKKILYKQNAKLRAQKHLEYKKLEACKKCSLQDICDGFHNDYISVFGENEAKSVDLNLSIIDPTYFVDYQFKVVE
jgi:MoaA/NifB/PqqE/SkfB family radical SAM enzyme